MSKKTNSILSIILPNKKTNIFVLFIIILGIISGTIFLLVLNDTDKELVTNQITNFFTNINTNNINNGQAFTNSLTQNFIFIILVWVLGMSMIGIFLNIFLIYMKGFIIGFSVSSFFLIYEYKGLIAGLIYLVPTSIINILIVLMLGTYSIMFTMTLWKHIFSKTKGSGFNSFLKKYFLILGICLLLGLVTAITESYLLPTIFKIFITLFI